MLSFIFKLRIDWYSNKGQTSSTVNERNVVSLRFVAQRDISVVFTKLFLITGQ